MWNAYYYKFHFGDGLFLHVAMNYTRSQIVTIEAEEQRKEAEEQRKEAEEQRKEAEEQLKRANEERMVSAKKLLQAGVSEDIVASTLNLSMGEMKKIVQDL